MGKSIGKFLLAIVLIAAVLYVAIAGVQFPNGWRLPAVTDTEHGIRLGLDLTGGSIITYEAEVDNPSSSDMNTVVSMLRKRLDDMGYTEATVALSGTKRVTVEIPNIDDPEEAVAQLGATAQLQFIDSDNNVILTGNDVASARAEYTQVSENSAAEQIVSLELTSEGATKFSEATARIKDLPDGNNYIAIKLDDQEISKPSVTVQIPDGQCYIHGNFTAESAKWLSDIINSGRLPFSIKNVELQNVGPTLGDQALTTSIYAGILGTILVMLFMLLIYRLPGLVADISLLAYIGLTLLVLSNAHINLSLPGIAGVILTIGMAVDANVLIFERMKEELRNGKTLRASIDAGFNRAFAAILDGQVTTAFAGIILYFFGTGTIKGFATTLLIGIVLNMFTAIVVTKFILRQMVGFNVKNLFLYGLRKKEGKYV